MGEANYKKANSFNDVIIERLWEAEMLNLRELLVVENA
jgi:hypothetical protein